MDVLLCRHLDAKPQKALTMGAAFGPKMSSQPPGRISAFLYGHLLQVKTAILAWWYRNDLGRLAVLFSTDKWGSHWYTQHYQRYFEPLKRKRLNVLEIGIGGYRDAAAGGGSLRMWKAYFRRSRIVGIDVYDKSRFRESRIDIRQCNQTDAEGLGRLSEEYGGFDIVVDDGSHINEHVIKTFNILFPLLRPNGIYAIEDLQTAYWPGWGGGIDNPHSSMAFIKSLVDGLNHAEYPIEDYVPTWFEQNIVELAFFHNLVLIRKGSNNETTNMPVLRKREMRRTRRSPQEGTSQGGS
jgi:hypothetical protein